MSGDRSVQEMLDIFPLFSTICARWVKLLEIVYTISRESDVKRDCSQFRTSLQTKFNFTLGGGSNCNTELPITLNCWQFPLRLCFAMSTNKAQGQTLQYVGIYLPDHVFTHGQLYVAFSRVQDPSALAVYLNNPDGFTRNIVFYEVLWILTLHIHFVQNTEISVPLSHSVRSTGWPLVLQKKPLIKAVVASASFLLPEAAGIKPPLIAVEFFNVFK